MNTHPPSANSGNYRYLGYKSSREVEIRQLVDGEGTILEIGPSYNPIFPKSDGFRVVTIDHADAATLKEKYSSHQGVDTSKIEEVDHVWRGEPLSELVGTDKFDLIVASHVIEHTPDMLGFLCECEKALTPSGRLLLAVPDRRRCFDFFRPFSTTGAVLQAHLEKRKLHSPGTTFDFVANFSSLDTTMGEKPPKGFNLSNTVTGAKSLFERAAVSQEYIDVHAWVLTPSSFRLIVSDLNAVGALALREEFLWDTPIFEFVTVLSRQGKGCTMNRAELLVACHEEASSPRAPLPGGTADTP